MSLIEKLSVVDVKKYNHHPSVKNFVEIVLKCTLKRISGENDYYSELEIFVNHEKDPQNITTSVFHKEKIDIKYLESLVELVKSNNISIQNKPYNLPKTDPNATKFFYPIFESIVHRYLSRGYITSLESIKRNEYLENLKNIYDKENQSNIDISLLKGIMPPRFELNKYANFFFSSTEYQHFFKSLDEKIFELLEASTKYESDYDVFLQQQDFLQKRTKKILQDRFYNNSYIIAKLLTKLINKISSNIQYKASGNKIVNDIKPTMIIRQIIFNKYDPNVIPAFKNELRSLLLTAESKQIITIRDIDEKTFITDDINRFKTFIQEQHDEKVLNNIFDTIYINKYMIEISTIENKKNEYTIKLKQLSEILRLLNFPYLNNEGILFKRGENQVDSKLKEEEFITELKKVNSFCNFSENFFIPHFTKSKSTKDYELVKLLDEIPYILKLGAKGKRSAKRIYFYKYEFITISESNEKIIINLNNNINLIMDLARNIRDNFIEKYNLLAKLRPVIKKEEFDGSRTLDIMESIKKSLENGKPIAYQRYKKRKKDDPAYLFLSLDLSGSMAGSVEYCKFFLILVIIFFEYKLHKLIIGYITTNYNSNQLFPNLEGDEITFRSFLANIENETNLNSLNGEFLNYLKAIKESDEKTKGINVSISADFDITIKNLLNILAKSKHLGLINQIRSEYENKKREILIINDKRLKIFPEINKLKEDFNKTSDNNEKLIIRKSFASKSLNLPEFTYLSHPIGKFMLKEFDITDLEASISDFVASSLGGGTNAYVMEELVKHKYMNNKGLKYVITITDAELGGGSERKYNPIVRNWIASGGVGAMQYWLKVAKDRNDTRSMFVKVTNGDENIYEYFSQSLSYYKNLENYYKILSLLDENVRKGLLLQEEMDYQNFLMMEDLKRDYFGIDSNGNLGFYKNNLNFKDNLGKYEYFSWLEKNQDSAMSISRTRLANPLTFEYLLKKLYQQDFFIFNN